MLVYLFRKEHVGRSKRALHHSRQDRPDDLARVDGQAFVAAVAGEGEAEVVEAELIEDRGVDVMNMNFVLDGVEAELVGRAEGGAGFDAAAGHEHAETVRVVVAAVLAFGHRGPAEFTAPDDEGAFEESPALEVFDQRGDGAVAPGAELGVVAFEVAVGVPLTARSAIKLDEPDATLDEASGAEAHRAELLAAGVVESVEGFGLGRFLGEIDGFGGLGLHSVGEFVGGESGGEA